VRPASIRESVEVEVEVEVEVVEVQNHGMILL